MQVVAVLTALAALAARADAQVCEGDRRPLEPSRDLYCIALIPASGIMGSSGHVALRRKPGPFTVDVTAEGRIRHSPVLTLAGLPRPSELGPYSTYVAWVATPVMHPVARLGVVTNGDNHLPAITHDKFVVLVTAERSPNGADMQGRMVLRGESPSTRLQPPDLMQFAIGAVPESARVGGEGHAHHVPAASGADSARWTTVPMPEGLQMLPAEMLLRPGVAPYLPRPSAALPKARPRELVRLSNGDTVHLKAGLVQRSFKGRTLTMYGFNDQYPGPLIMVRHRAEVVVELENALDQPTTIHWHGIRLENQFDGVPDMTQQVVQPGARFMYRVKFPDAGIYWYHPHVREDVQQDLGLYGNLLVRSERRDYFSPANREEVLMLDDILLNDGEEVVPFGASAPTHALMGRFGNVMLVNGEPSYSDSAATGEVVRYFLTNVSNTRTFNFSFSGGNYEREEWVESVVLSPAERYIVHVRFDRPGRFALVNRVQVLDHLFGRFSYKTDTLGLITVASRAPSVNHRETFATLRADTAVRADIARYRQHFARAHDKALVMTVAARDLPFFSRQMMQLDSLFFSPVEWEGTMPGMNWAATGDQVEWILRDPATGKQNMDIDWSFTRGDVVKVRLSNERESLHAMQHPIHFHGQRFLVLAVNDVDNTNLVWKDTVLVPAGFTVDLLLELSNPGRWMVHCHIAEHLSAHMMMAFTVH
jgi:suppressor of ftsI